MEILALKIPDQLTPAEHDQFFQLLPPPDREKVARLLRPQDARRQLVATVFLRTALCRRLNLSNDRLVIRRGPHGKPYLDAAHRLRFNLSHAGEFAVAALAAAEIGIDIEPIAAREMAAVATFFSPQEFADYQRQPPARRPAFFFDLWTAKESFIKATGQGFALDLAQFTIGFEPTITVTTTLDPRTWYFKRYEVDPGYKMTVCALENDFPTTVEWMERTELGSAPPFQEIS